LHDRSLVRQLPDQECVQGKIRPVGNDMIKIGCLFVAEINEQHPIESHRTLRGGSLFGTDSRQ